MGKLIGLAGLKGAGKDSAAFYLSRCFGFRRLALADPIRDGLLAMLDLTLDELNNRAFKEAPIDWLGCSPRHLMQTLGTEWGRTHIAGDLWLRIASRRISASQNEGHRNIVITDIRFENEAEWIREQGGVIWHIVRPADSDVSDQHLSEAGIQVWPGDEVILNRGSLDDLGACVIEAAGKLGA